MEKDKDVGLWFFLSVLTGLLGWMLLYGVVVLFCYYGWMSIIFVGVPLLVASIFLMCISVSFWKDTSVGYK